MNYFTKIERIDPATARELDAPGGFESGVRGTLFAKWRWRKAFSETLSHLDQDARGRVALCGELARIQALQHDGLLQGLGVEEAWCPDAEATTVVENFAGPAIPAHPLGEFVSRSGQTVISFLPEVCGPGVLSVADHPLPPASAGLDADVLRHVESRVEAAVLRMREVFQPGNTVLFASETEYVHCLRVSAELRRRKVRTIYLKLNRDSRLAKDAYFDLCLDAGGHYEIFFRLLNALPFSVIHFSGWMNSHHLAAAAALLAECPFVADLNDIPHYFLPEGEYDKIFGKGVFMREDHALRTLLRHADGLSINCSRPYASRLLSMLEAPASLPWRTFHSYPLEDFFREPEASDPLSVVFPGSLAPSNFPEAAFADAQVIRLAREAILPAGMSYHVFVNPLSGGDTSERYWDYRHLALDSQRFQIHPGLTPRELTGRLARLGWGGMCYLLEERFKVDLDHYRSLIPSKAFTLLEAGLPLICNEEFEALAAIVKEWNLGIVVSQKDLRTRLGELARAADMDALRANVRRYREENAMRLRIDDLLDVYEAAGGLPCTARDNGGSRP